MSAITAIFTVLIGLVGGAVIAWLFLSRLAAARTAQAVDKARGEGAVELAGIRATLEEKTGQLRDREVELVQAHADLKQEQNKLIAEREARASAEGEINKLNALRENDTRVFKDRLQELADAENRLKEAFKALANQTLLEVVSEHRKVARGELDDRTNAVKDLVKPIEVQLESYKQAINQLEVKREGAYQGLLSELKVLSEAEKALHKEAENLSTALRKKPHERGRWGELQLRNIIEWVGMQKFCDFTEQESLDNRLKPDLIVSLPNRGRIAVDAKVTLESYVAAFTAPEAEAEQYFKAYAQAVKSRVAELSKKEYWDRLEGAFDYVLMFIGHEASYNLALEYEPELIKIGVDQRVIIVTPGSLIGVLRAIWLGWQEAQVNEKAREIWSLGNELYERIRVFTSHMDDLRKALKNAVEAHDKAVGSIESRILPSARKFPELGVTVKGEILDLEPLGLEPRKLSAPDMPSTGGGDSDGEGDAS